MWTHLLLFVVLLSPAYSSSTKKPRPYNQTRPGANPDLIRDRDKDSRSGKKPRPYNQTRPGAKFDNPDFIRDRDKDEIDKPMMPEGYASQGKDPFHPAWMDYCDPYHCNDYHKLACGLNRRRLKFKFFQSVCHLILNNKCATFRGNLKYDIVDVKYCYIYVMYLRLGCRECEDGGGVVCGISQVDNHVALFRDQCAMEKANCEPDSFHEYEEVDLGMCAYYLDMDKKKLE